MLKNIIYFRWTKIIFRAAEFIIGLFFLLFLGKFIARFNLGFFGLIFLLIASYFYYLIAEWIVNFFTTIKLAPYQLSQIIEKGNFTEEEKVHVVKEITNWRTIFSNRTVTIKGKLTIQQKNNLLSLSFFSNFSLDHYKNNLSSYLQSIGGEVEEKTASPWWFFIHFSLLAYFLLILLLMTVWIIIARAAGKSSGGAAFGTNYSSQDDYSYTLQTKRFPKEVKEILARKIRELSSSGKDKETEEKWIEYLLSFPWCESSKKNWDLDLAQKQLDRDHYGMEEVKQEIIEYLAISKRKNESQGKFILLVGPPGTGKTSLSKSIAEATGRKFVRISLGGVSDEAEIRGHRRTYIGAMPGKIVQAVKKSGVNDPVILLDEIGRMIAGKQAGNRGDPSAALLEVLDPEQNSQFDDHYMGVPVDLSKVLFIGTANSVENLPAALLDRAKLIWINSYTEKEKFHISRNYLWKKVLGECELDESQLSLPDLSLEYIIKNYAREAGIRELERLLKKITAVFTVKLEKGERQREIISQAKIKEYLGEPPFIGDYSNSNPAGVVNGLAYTDSGGSVLQIEVSHFFSPHKKNELILTGNLGKTMKESAQVALNFIKTAYPELFINEPNIIIHALQGSTPKEGPSAGISFAVAILSSLKKQPVPSHIGMTGEIGLKGKILRIGGLREKLNAAVREKLKIALIPSGQNLKDIPQDLKETIKIIPVNGFSAAWETIERENK